MAGQETLRRHNGVAERPARAIRRNVADLAHDAIALLELQAKLFKLDLKDGTRQTLLAVAIIIGGACILLACATVGLAAFGYFLTDYGGLSHAAGFAISAATGAVLSAMLLLIGWLQLRKSFGTISRSREEFERNLHWFKSVLKQNNDYRSSEEE